MARSMQKQQEEAASALEEFGRIYSSWEVSLQEESGFIKLGASKSFVHPSTISQQLSRNSYD